MRLELATFRANAGVALSGGLMSQWRVGAIVEAIAVRDASDGKLWLNIGNTRVPARIASGDAAGPANGERLQLRVLRDSPVLALETVAPDEVETATTTGDALRRFLPRQSSPAPLLANLAWLTEHTDDAARLGKNVTDALTRLWMALPTAEELGTPEGLAKAMNRSGAFLEANLAQSEPGNARAVLGGDLKSLLLAVKQTLLRNGVVPRTDTAPPPGPLPTLRGPLLPLDSTSAGLAAASSPPQQLSELGAQTDGALARINTLQLLNSEAATQGAAWLIEIPLRRDGQPETVRFRFERHSQAESTDQSWTVEAALDLGAAGALHARVTMYGKRVGVQLRAEPPRLVTELNAKTALLTTMLNSAGLDVDRIVCLHGMPNEDRAAQTAALLDVRA